MEQGSDIAIKGGEIYNNLTICEDIKNYLKNIKVIHDVMKNIFEELDENVIYEIEKFTYDVPALELFLSKYERKSSLTLKSIPRCPLLMNHLISNSGLIIAI